MSSMGDKRLDISEPLLEVNFYCKHCRSKFARQPDRVEDAPERHHPYLYYGNCQCGREAGQAHWEKGLMAAYGRGTGPRTPEGKAKMRLNLAKTHTPEIHARTRFNGLKTGLHATVTDVTEEQPDEIVNVPTPLLL